MKKNNKTEFTHKGYIGSIEFSLADNCLFGKVQGLSKMLLSYEGNTLEELEADFKSVVDEYLEDCEKDNVKAQKPFTGSFNIRLTPELHKLAAVSAKRLGTSLNSFVKTAVEERIKHLHHA